MIGRIQLMLNKFGYSAGSVNGKLSEQTRTAISDYQMENLLPVDGRVSKGLLTHLSGSNQAPLIALSPSSAQVPSEPDWQWRRLVLDDTFADGNFTANPSWTVVAGRFWIEGRAGLRSAASGDNPRINQPDRAEIYIDQSIGSAFAIRATISARQSGGQLEFGPYLGAGRSQGYRLFYSPENDGRFGLRRISARGATVLMSQRRFQLADGSEHSLLWTKDGNGVIVVTFDGSELLRFSDPEFRQGFDGFTLINRGGEYGLREIRINSAG
jgi:peptidoglycan hydrolase-like protein with peptidoglycan-binding domain